MRILSDWSEEKVDFFCNGSETGTFLKRTKRVTWIVEEGKEVFSVRLMA